MRSPTTRPGLVWLITIFHALVFALLALMGWYAFIRWDTFPESAKAPLRAVSPGDWIRTALGTSLTIISIVQLFRMRRSALYLYAIGVIVSVTMSVWYYSTGAYHPSARSVIALLIQLLICFYVWRLQRANLLR